MLELLLKVVGLGIASAMSPVILGVAVSTLAGKDRPVKKALALLAGALITAALVLSASAAFATHLLSIGKGVPGGVLAYFDIGLGAVFILFALFSVLKKEKPANAGKHPASNAGFAKWLALGFLLNATNFDAILLYFTEIKLVFHSGAGIAEAGILLLIATGFFTLPATLPLAVYSIAPARAARMLEPVGAWMKKYGNLVVSAIFLAFGAYLLYSGITLL